MLRPYQQEAVDCTIRNLHSKEGNPCIVIPTAGGKSHCIAELCKHFINEYPKIQIVVLAHVKELIQQNSEKLSMSWPEHPPFGIYCAGLGLKQKDKQITFASIQSIYNKKIKDYHLIICDEVHRVPADGEGMYRTFIESNPRAKVVGFTATPYRTKSGSIVGKDNILNYISYEAKIPELIKQGYLSIPITKTTKNRNDFSKVAIKQGDFDTQEMADIFNKNDLIDKSCNEISNVARNRNHIICFCVNIEHAEKVCDNLNSNFVMSDVLHSKLSQKNRDDIIRRFKEGKLRCIVNVGILTEGFDAPFIDCVCLLRATMSPGLMYQMIGRGFRIHPDKKDFLVLDFGENICRHGCIDDIKTQPKEKAKKKGEAPVKVCPKCYSICHLAVKECKDCGYIFESENDPHKPFASMKSILSKEEKPIWVKINRTQYIVHSKVGKPNSLRVVYHTDFQWYNEYICLEHEGYARDKAINWWNRRAKKYDVPNTIEKAYGISKNNGLIEPERIRIQKNGKYFEIIGYDFPPEEVDIDDDIPY